MAERYPTPEEKKKLDEARAYLSKILNEFWATETGFKIKNELSRRAFESGWASAMERALSRIASELKDEAARIKLRRHYWLAWGQTEKAEAYRD